MQVIMSGNFHRLPVNDCYALECTICIIRNSVSSDSSKQFVKILGRKVAAEGYELYPASEYGKMWPERGNGSPIGNARKCHFCLHRLAIGMLPACVTTCVGRATFFGDRNDPESLMFFLLGSPRLHRLKEELGTQPAVYYLM